MAKFFVGIDIGTSSIKIALVEIESDGSASVASQMTRRYSTGHERDVTTWQRMAQSMLLALNPPQAPLAIGFSGQMHSLIPLDATRHPVSAAMLWCDMQGLSNLQRFIGRHCSSEEFVVRTGNLPLPDFTLAKWLYLKDTEPSLAKRICHLPGAKDIIRWALDPTQAPVTDPTDAAGTQFYNPFLQSWDQDMLQWAAVPPSALSTVRPSSVITGTVHGLNRLWSTTVLVNGAGDQATSSRAVGATTPGLASLSLGTSGVLAVPLEKGTLPDRWTGAFHLFPSADPNMYQVIATIPALGSGLTWAANLLGVELPILDELAQEGSTIDFAEEHPSFFPFLDGMGAPHPDTTIRARLYGLHSSIDRRVVAWTIYQGFAMELRTLVNNLHAEGISVDRVTFSGGTTKLSTFISTIAAYLAVPCFMAPASAGSAEGAALIAADAMMDSNTARFDASQPILVGARAMDPYWTKLREGY